MDDMSLRKVALDYLIVGGGSFGAAFARNMADRGCLCAIVERRAHLGGLCHSEVLARIHVHRFGAHIFHTADEAVWRFVNRWSAFHPYRHTVCVRVGNRVFSIPINLHTLHQLWGVRTPAEAEAKLESVREPIEVPQNLEEWCLAHMGRELYELFIRGYTKKQWQREPRDLPAAIVQRLPLRTSFNTAYFDDPYQGIPVDGYARFFERMLEGIPVELGVDYFLHRGRLNRMARKIVFTGRIDEYFGFCYGPLDYRTLRFETQELPVRDYQGCAVVNYPEESVPFTRIIEHKHFLPGDAPTTVITHEYPEAWRPDAEPYYPICDAANLARYQKYKALADRTPNVIFGGRLAEYRYLNMDQVIASGMAAARREMAGRKPARSRRISLPTTARPSAGGLDAIGPTDGRTR